MLETVVATILNRVVGAYVENFDPKQLNIGILSGDVKLRNLRLKRAALDRLHLPVNVVDGHVGSLILQIPYSNLKGKPVKILIEDVFLLAEPDLSSSAEPNSDSARRDYATKLDKLEIWELSQRTASTDASNADNPNFVSSLVTKVIDNLQITIKNIHLRYEDNETVPLHPFATGITLAELSAVSTNKDWVPEFITEVTAVTHKLATLDSFSLYWDTDAKSYPTSLERTEFFDLFKEKISDIADQQHLLRPVNGQGFIKLDKNPATEATPKIKAKLEFEELALAIDHEQYTNLLELGDRFHRYLRTREFRRKRPPASPKEDPRAWFKYAANVVLESIREKNRQWTWESMQTRWNEFKEYRELYKKQVFEPLNQADQSRFDDLQRKYTLDDLMFFRKVAKYELKNETVRERAVHESKRAVSSWGSWLWGAGSQTINRPNEPQHDLQFSEEDKRELYDVLDLDEHGNALEDVSTHQTLLDVEFALRSGSVQLRETAESHLASLSFTGSKTKFVNRADSMLFSISLDDFGVHDHTPDTRYPHIVEINRNALSVAREDGEGESPFFWLLFETHPLDRVADSNLFLKSRSLTIVHNARLLERVVQFFTPDADKYETVDAIVNAANKTVEELREQTRLGLEYALQEHKTLNLQLDVKAPVILVPLDPTAETTPTVLIDSGSLTVSSDLVKREVLDQVKSKQAAQYTEADWKKLESLMYDRFTITLSQTQIVLGQSASECYTAISESAESPARILSPTTLQFLLEISIMPQTRSLTQSRLSISLPVLDLTLADVQYKLFMRVIDSAIPQPGGSETQPDRIDLHQAITATDVDFDEPAPKPIVTGRRIFELRFNFESANLALVRGWDRVKIVQLNMQALELTFWMEDATKALDLSMRDLVLEDFVNTSAPSDLRRLISSRGTREHPLFRLQYRDDQTTRDVELNMAALRFVLTSTTLLTVYDYVMSTFAPPSESPVSSSGSATSITEIPATGSGDAADLVNSAAVVPATNAASTSAMTVRISLESVTALLNEDNIVLSQMELSSANLSVNLTSTIKFHAGLGAVSIVDMMDSGVPADSILRQILSIEGGSDLADFRYETFENEAFSSLLYFRSGSLQVNLVEEPLGRLLQFFAKFSQMKQVYDQARMMEFNQTIIDLPNNIKFDVEINAPTIIYPRLPQATSELLRAHLGEIYLKNHFHSIDGVKEAFVNTISAGIRNVKVTSQLYGAAQHLELLNDLDFTVDASISSPFEKISRPLAMVSATLSPVEVRLTEFQYLLGTQLMAMLSRLASSVGGLDTAEVGDLRQKLAAEKNLAPSQKEYWRASDQAAQAPQPTSNADKLSLQFSAPEIVLNLYKGTEKVRDSGDLSSAALSSFKLAATECSLNVNSESVLTGDFGIKSFTIEDARSVRDNKFNEIVPPIKNDSDQFTAHVVGRPGQPVYIKAAVDSPKVILALDYLLAMKEFAAFADSTTDKTKSAYAKSPKSIESVKSKPPSQPTSPTGPPLPPRRPSSQMRHSAIESLRQYQDQLHTDTQDPQHESFMNLEASESIQASTAETDGSRRRSVTTLDVDAQISSAPPPPPAFHLDLSVTDLYLLLLADPSDSNSEAIVFKIEELLLGLKETATISVSHIGLFLTQMESQESFRLRVIDDFNFSLSVDSRRSLADAEICSVRGVVEPVIIRLSLREIWLMLAIVNKASALLKSPESDHNDEEEEESEGAESVDDDFDSESDTEGITEGSDVSSQSMDAVKIMGESCTIDLQGFKLVVIGPKHLMPILSGTVKPFAIHAKNWSSALRVDGSMELRANVYNFAKSAWEPLLDNFEVGLNVLQRDGLTSKQINIASRSIADIEVTPALVDIVNEVQRYFEGQDLDAVFQHSTKEHEEPYRIVNETGFNIEVSSECQDPDAVVSTQKLAPLEQCRWAFYDWRLVRENLHEELHALTLGITLAGTTFEPLHNICVNAVGEEMYPLRTAGSNDRTPHRLVVDVKIENHVKYVKIRSATSLYNATNVAIELRLMPQSESAEYDNYTLRLEPGERSAVPIMAVDSLIYVRPDRALGYSWGETPVYWRDLLAHSVTVRCHSESTPFYIQARQYSEDKELASRYGFMTINFCAPFILINNLPYDLDFKLFCRDEKVDFGGRIPETGREYLHRVSRLQLLLLSVQPLGDSGFNRSEFSIVNSRTKEYDVESEIVLRHKDGQRLKLQLAYIKLPNNTGAAIVISPPYVILNRTAHELAISTRLNRATMPLETDGTVVSENYDAVKYSKPKMWSFESSQSKNRAMFRLDDSHWSSAVNISAMGSLSELAIPSSDRQREMYLGLAVQDGSSRYHGIRIVSVSPRFVVCNNTSRALRLREPGGSDYSVLEAPAHMSVPVGFVSKFSEREMCVSFDSDAAIWSSAFSMANVGTVHLRLPERGRSTTLVKIDVTLEGATLFVHISETKQWPYSIRNFTDIELTMFQSNPFVDEEGFESRRFTPIRYRLPARSQMPYSWDFPAANLKELVLESGGRQRRVQLAEIGELRPARFPLPDGSLYVVNLNVIADGPKQALIISEFDPGDSHYRPQQRPMSSSASISSLASANEFVAHSLDDTSDTLGISVRFKGIGISYITNDNKELCYLTLRNLELNYNASQVFETFSWQCQWIQVDNCLAGDTEFPVILYPSVVPKTATEMQEHPTFSGSITRVKDDSYGLVYIKHATVLLQEITIEIDEGFLAEILRMVRRHEKKSLWLSDEPLLDKKDVIIPEAVSTTSANDVYFEQLHLQPTRLNVSFVRTGQLSLESWFQDEVNYFINAITMSLGNINDAPVQFNALLIENVRTRPELLSQSIKTHYSQEFIYQIYRVMGSADIIGNPVGLFNNLSSGVMDLFYEPYHGYTITDRPSEFGVGLARGGLSFMKKSVFGVSDSVSKVTGSLSKGLALMTLDDGYAKKRQARTLRNRPRHALYGISMGAMSFYDSFASGITGLAKQPLEGAATNGTAGFFEGLGRGLVGLPTKTMIGLLDMTSAISEGVRNTTTVFDITDIVRVRLPRVIAANRVITPYNPRAAAGQMVLHSADSSRYATDQYLAHTNLAAGRTVVVSLERIIAVSMSNMKSDWAVTYDQLASVVMEHSGINLKLHGGIRGPFIPLESESTRKYIYRHISDAVAAFNRRELLLA